MKKVIRKGISFYFLSNTKNCTNTINFDKINIFKKFVSFKKINQSIKAKFLSLFLVVILVLCGVNLISFILLRYSMGQLDNMVETTMTANNIKSVSIDTVAALNKYMGSKKSEDKKIITNQIYLLNNYSQYLIKNITAPISIAALESTNRLSGTLKKSLNKCMTFIDEKKYDQAVTEKQNIVKLTEYLKTAVDELLSVELSNNAIEKKNINEDANSLAVIISCIILILGTGSLLISFIITSKVMGNISKIANASRRIAEGNLCIDEIRIKSNDEIAILADSFNKMKSNLSSVIGNISNESKNVSSSSDALRDICEQSSNAIEQITSSLNAISQIAAVQFEQSEKTAKIVNNLYGVNKKVLENANGVNDTSNSAIEAANVGQENLNKLVHQINTISDKIANTSSALEILNKKSLSIKKVVDTITNISSQTRLISLNASIEASKAGEYGKGFSVVADEIRKLAIGTANSAFEITDMIKDIQIQSKQVYESMLDGVEEVNSGIEISKDVKGSFNKIFDTNLRVGDQVQDINKQIENMTKELYKVEQMSTGFYDSSKKLSDGSSEIAAAMGEQGASLEEIAVLSTVLSNMSQKLDKMVNKFVIY